MFLLRFVFFFPFRVDFVAHTLLLFFFDFFGAEPFVAGVAVAAALLVPSSSFVSTVREESCFCFFGGGSSSEPSPSSRPDFGDFLEPSEAASSSERSSEGSGSDRASFGGSVGVSDGVLVVAGGASSESASVVGGGCGCGECKQKKAERVCLSVMATKQVTLINNISL